MSEKLTVEQKNLLRDASEHGWAYCAYSPVVERAANKLEKLNLVRLTESDCGPTVRITDKGRAALAKETGK